MRNLNGNISTFVGMTYAQKANNCIQRYLLDSFATHDWYFDLDWKFRAKTLYLFDSLQVSYYQFFGICDGGG